MQYEQKYSRTESGIYKFNPGEAPIQILARLRSGYLAPCLADNYGISSIEPDIVDLTKYKRWSHWSFNERLSFFGRAQDQTSFTGGHQNLRPPIHVVPELFQPEYVGQIYNIADEYADIYRDDTGTPRVDFDFVSLHWTNGNRVNPLSLLPEGVAMMVTIDNLNFLGPDYFAFEGKLLQSKRGLIPNHLQDEQITREYNQRVFVNFMTSLLHLGVDGANINFPQKHTFGGTGAVFNAASRSLSLNPDDFARLGLLDLGDSEEEKQLLQKYFDQHGMPRLNPVILDEIMNSNGIPVSSMMLVTSENNVHRDRHAMKRITMNGVPNRGPNGQPSTEDLYWELCGKLYRQARTNFRNVLDTRGSTGIDLKRTNMENLLYRQVLPHLGYNTPFQEPVE